MALRIGKRKISLVKSVDGRIQWNNLGKQNLQRSAMHKFSNSTILRFSNVDVELRLKRCMSMVEATIGKSMRWAVILNDGFIQRTRRGTLMWKKNVRHIYKINKLCSHIHCNHCMYPIHERREKELKRECVGYMIK